MLLTESVMVCPANLIIIMIAPVRFLLTFKIAVDVLERKTKAIISLTGAHPHAGALQITICQKKHPSIQSRYLALFI